MLDFAGGSSFATEQHTGRIFVMNIKNDQKDDAKVVLFPSIATDKKALVVKDGAIIGNSTEGYVTSSSASSSIQLLHDYLKIAPSNLVGVKIESTDSSQLSQILTIKEASPFRTMESKEIFLGTYLGADAVKNIINVPTNGVILGPETELALNIVSGANLNITFFFGAVVSQSTALKKKLVRAVKSISRVGLDRVKPQHLLR
jgi:hypothetical protein